MSEASKSQSFLFLSFLWEYLRASAFELWDTSRGTILEVDTILQFDTYRNTDLGVYYICVCLGGKPRRGMIV